MTSFTQEINDPAQRGLNQAQLGEKYMKHILRKYWMQIFLGVMILAYVGYFSYLSVLRYRTIYASYFDLGIMHQTVYNTYRAIVTMDPSRFLELTNPFGADQIKRMAIHNDILLVLYSIFYILCSGPETLLILQTIILGSGAIAVFLLAKKVLGGRVFPLIFAFSYLMYSPMQRANLFDFHAVTATTSLLLFMFYFYEVKRYRLSLLFFVLSILSKEQVALTTFFFGAYALFRSWKSKDFRFPVTILLTSVIWFLLSVTVIIPYFRGGRHFALGYYEDFGNGVILKYVFHRDTYRYFLFLLGPLGFISVLSPFELLISLPEFAINLFSSNLNMRNIIYQYTSAIQPFVFISAIYGTKKLVRYSKSVVPIVLIILTFAFSFTKGPLPLSKEQEIHPFAYPQKEIRDVELWFNILKDESIKISASGKLSPFFTSRRYFYDFSDRYTLADYVVLRRTEVYNYPEKDTLIPVYEQLQKDDRFKLIYKNGDFEVYKKVKFSNPWVKSN